MTALITGGGRGIGAAIARRLAARGESVTIVSRTKSELDLVAGETGAKAEVCDVSNPEQVEALARRVGPVQILVNNAGAAEGASFAKTDLALWRRMMDTNATSTFLMCKAFVPGMVVHNYGRIVNMASLAGLHGASHISAYAAAKHAVIGLTTSLADELEKYDIRVNAICPGYVDTPMTRANLKKVYAATGRPEEELLKAMLMKLGQERILDPEEVAAVVIPLALPECPQTGKTITV